LAIVITQGVFATFDIPGATAAYVVVVAGNTLFGVTAKAGILVLFLDVGATDVSRRAFFSGGSFDNDLFLLRKNERIFNEIHFYVYN